jgi:hypothetical protein
MVGIGPVGVVVVEGRVAVAVVVVVAAVVVVVVVIGGLVVDVVVVSVVPGGSSVTVPMTQYSTLGSRSGQVMPGFSSCSSLTDSPQEPPKLSHVAPLPGVIAKRQSTARRDRAMQVQGRAQRQADWLAA